MKPRPSILRSAILAFVILAGASPGSRVLAQPYLVQVVQEAEEFDYYALYSDGAIYRSGALAGEWALHATCPGAGAAVQLLEVFATGDLTVAMDSSEIWTYAPGGPTWDLLVTIPGSVTAAQEAPGAPEILEQNHPNPFNPATTIAVRTEVPVFDARVVIFDPSGRAVRTIRIGDLEPVAIRVVWDGRDDAGGRLPSGTYLYQFLHSGGASEARKAILLK